GCSMRADVTWAGDVGQALVDYVTNGSAGDAAAYFDTAAPPEQLLGDIDGYVLGDTFAGSGIDVASVLTTAYLDGDYEQHRFEQLAGLLGADPAQTVGAEV